MTGSKQPGGGLYRVFEGKDGDLRILLKEGITALNCAGLLQELKFIEKRKPAALAIDLKEVPAIDDFGVVVLLTLKERLKASGGSFRIDNPSEEVRRFLELVNFEKLEVEGFPKKRRSRNLLVRIGESAINEVSNVRLFVSFLGAVILCAGHVLLHPRSLRFDDTVSHMEKTGVEAIPIVALISFLLGLVMAFMSSIQLQQFGANIYVASLVALAMVSELGPIMTAIIVAGRSGSAYAAEIGTMKISEEIDALFTMGFDPTLFLALPRIIASLIVVPVLTLFSDLFAITGGLMVGVFLLDLTPGNYISQTVKTLSLFEVMWGLFKSGVFAVLIAWTGCLRGFQARGGASAVGDAATSAVVTSIFLIILFDSFFAIFRSYYW